MTIAISEARKCTPKETGFSVGCVLVARYPGNETDPVVLSTGYSRELEGNTHAEANAMEKARRLSQDELHALFPAATGEISIDAVFKQTDVYTTLEPCSIRTSGLPPCADSLIAARIHRCIIGVGEPDDFVDCEGGAKLTDAGIEIVWMEGMEEVCLTVARAGRTDIRET